jgi:hypothetical protein
MVGTKGVKSVKSPVNTFLFAHANLPLAVVVARTKWDEAPRMRHQLTRQLMRKFNVIFIELFHERELAPTQDKFQKISDRLLVFSPGVPFFVAKRLYTNDPATHFVVNLYLRRKINRVAGTFISKCNLLVNFAYDFPEIMAERIFDYKIYVCFDEFPKMWRRAKHPNKLKFAYQSRLGQHYEDQVAKRADINLATHELLVDKLKKVNPNILLIMHGHEFQSIPNNKSTFDPDYSKIRVGFMGYITYNLLVDWLVALLEEQDIELSLIGPLHKFDPSHLLKYKNFQHIPTITGVPLIETLETNDVLIMPYNPAIPEVYVQTVSNKFFQYIAVGRPVVISDMPYYIEMPKGVLYRAKTADEFVAKVRDAYKEDCETYVQVRKAIAAQNTWDQRGDQLFEILEKAIPDLSTS